MNVSEETLKDFINQQIELYGDEAVISTDLFLQTDKKPELIQNEFLYCEGNPEASLVLVAETSESNAIPLGSFFGNETGLLLEKILKAIDFDRKQVLVCSLPKFQPQNEFDESNKIEQTGLNLEKQLDQVEPAFILCLGKTASRILLEKEQDVNSLHGQMLDYKSSRLMVTYHPLTLIKKSELKRTTWEDIKFLKREYDKYVSNNYE